MIKFLDENGQRDKGGVTASRSLPIIMCRGRPQAVPLFVLAPLVGSVAVHAFLPSFLSSFVFLSPLRSIPKPFLPPSIFHFPIPRESEWDSRAAAAQNDVAFDGEVMGL